MFDGPLTSMNLTSALAIAALSLLAGVAGAQQGISKNEIPIPVSSKLQPGDNPCN